MLIITETTFIYKNHFKCNRPANSLHDTHKVRALEFCTYVTKLAGSALIYFLSNLKLFLVLGLSLLCGQSPAAYPRTCREVGLLRMLRGANDVLNSRHFLGFWSTTSIRLYLLQFCLSILIVSCSNLTFYINNQVVFRFFFCKSPP